MIASEKKAEGKKMYIQKVSVQYDRYACVVCGISAQFRCNCAWCVVCGVVCGVVWRCVWCVVSSLADRQT